MQLEVITRTPLTPSPKPPIVCVHGGYHGAWCWDEYFLPYFAEQGFAAHALSLRGHGQSLRSEPINQWRIADYVADVAQVAAQLAMPPIWIGHSLGGVVVQKYLEQQPAPAGVLLASSPLQGMMATSLKLMARYPWPMLKMLFTFNMLHARPVFENIFFSATMPREQRRAYLDRMGNESFRAFMDILLFDKPDPRRIATPMLVIGGEQDSSIPPAINRALAAAYHTQLETFPVAHDMMLEKNWQLVARHIVAWLNPLSF